MPLSGEERLRLGAVQDEGVRSDGSGLCRILVGHSKAAWISREEARPANIPKFQEEHDDTLEADATSAVLESYLSRRATDGRMRSCLLEDTPT